MSIEGNISLERRPKFAKMFNQSELELYRDLFRTKPLQTNLYNSPLKDIHEVPNLRETEEEIKFLALQFLSSLTFLHFNRYNQAKMTKIASLEASILGSLYVPTNIIVSLAGCDSFAGRGIDGNGSKKSSDGSTSTSLDTILLYTKWPTGISATDTLYKKIPPVGMIGVYRQPNGILFADNLAGDSHRISAMILRGYPLIPCKQIFWFELEDNFFDESGKLNSIR